MCPLLPRLVLLVALASGCAGFPPRGADPVTTDPAVADPANPPRLVELRIDSHGAAMNAILYVADGAGPHPTAILLHGFPGNERNLDLAQAVRRAGWNVLFFHYRGAWGSEGDFSFGHVLEDVGAAVAWVGDPGRGQDLRIDPDRVALIGHSMGGFAALRAGADLDEVDCIVSIAGANLASRGYAAQEDPDVFRAMAEQLEVWSAPLSGTSGEALVREEVDAGTDFDIFTQVPALAVHPLLLVAGSLDRTTPPQEHHAPLVAALEAAGAPHLRHVVLEADHAFSQRRIALTRDVIDFLGDVCLPNVRVP